MKGNDIAACATAAHQRTRIATAWDVDLEVVVILQIRCKVGLQRVVRLVPVERCCFVRRIPLIPVRSTSVVWHGNLYNVQRQHTQPGCKQAVGLER